ncbi:class I SAM-dependent methyltransferase [Mycobacterium gordonae]|uniref:Methyltransferase type 11 n=2 Tax=Mycobacterium gordonae TaxID=1778 RepID=A0A1A6BAP9_MYCGO|nr:class I SAM-dependent methyltransferase [Mycobacterium gordonae]MCV7006704.1 class I SAM-dependent methyltransferase [Mycobacterium gordonae]OBR99397.1 methyltransferase type 11 [Mycobacterium gordonae]ODR20531.1 16S rRNA (cytosine(1402)-N(4))-methyltransferase [Mycobacterium gordonae]ORV82113.1 methyltransferase type 11 [Mycobacterium gordonae]
MSAQSFTPAAGDPKYTKYYDTVIALLTREDRWRSAVIARLELTQDDVVVDVGCGTASLAIRIKQQQPGARVIGVDPDPQVLAIARAKVRRAGVQVEFVEGMGDRAVEFLGPGMATKVVSSLVLHQCPVPMKKAMIGNMFTLLRPGGELVIADYGLQRDALMRLGFRIVQFVDGKRDTQPNADGILPGLIEQAGFADVAEVSVIRTGTGSISLYRATRPVSGDEANR